MVKEDNLEKQNSNIVQSNFLKILNFKNAKPNLIWKKAKNESYGELKENEKIINEVKFYYENEYSFLRQIDMILNKYLNIISIATKEMDAKKIFFSTKEAVLKINNINKIHRAIHTGQREDLCQFFEDVVQETGFNIETDDFTSEWRKW